MFRKTVPVVDYLLWFGAGYSMMHRIMHAFVSWRAASCVVKFFVTGKL
ncbi:MAG: hypothetical protein ACYTBP_01280 [Planctomycetota bacterium]